MFQRFTGKRWNGATKLAKRRRRTQATWAQRNWPPWNWTVPRVPITKTLMTPLDFYGVHKWKRWVFKKEMLGYKHSPVCYVLNIRWVDNTVKGPLFFSFFLSSFVWRVWSERCCVFFFSILCRVLAGGHSSRRMGQYLSGKELLSQLFDHVQYFFQYVFPCSLSR